jgi:gas vesicle protein
MRDATGAEAEALRGEIADDIERHTEQVEHARLSAAESGEEFLVASRAQLTQIDEDIQDLQAETALMSDDARARVGGAISELRFEADHLEETVSSIAEAGEEEVSEVRDDLAQAIASLTASVRREWLEIRNAQAAP